MTEQPETEIRDIERIVRGSTIHEVDGAQFAVVPNGYKLEDLEKLQQAPRRIRENVVLHTVDAFIEYAKEWRKTGVSVIFANEEARSLRAVIDYHSKLGEVDAASWGTHKASYTAKFSREALAWMGKNGKPMSQIEFAEFLEEHIADVVEPAGADLLERALKLQFIQKAVFGSAVRLQSGEFQLNWSEENQKGTVELPEKIALGIPLFHGGTAYKIEARLRYRLAEGKVTFTYKLVEIEAAIEHAFAEVVTKVCQEVTGVAIYQGGL